MTWVKLDDGYPEHLKVVGLSDAAFRTDIEGWCYCARNLTDGLILDVVAKRWPKKAITELIAANRWHDIDEGFVIHDYLEYNPSRDQVELDRSRRQAAGRAGGQASARRRARAPAGAMLPEHSNPDPSRPVPTPNSEAALRAVPANRPDPDQVYLAERISIAWGQRLSIPALQRLNNAHGRVAVTDALRQIHGFPPEEAIRSPYAYIEAICTQEVSA